MNEERLSAYCRAEIENLDRLLVEIKKLTKKSGKADPTLVELAALGTFFHNFYNGIENIPKSGTKIRNISTCGYAAVLLCCKSVGFKQY